MSSLTRYPWWRRWFGRKAERTAARFLTCHGYRILAANIDDQLGELDLLARHQGLLVVVEVRSSESRSLEEIAASVDPKKQKRIAEAVKRFLQRKRILGVSVRFDVLAIRWPPDAKPEFLLLPDAFQSPGQFQMW